MVLFLFVIMLLNLNKETEPHKSIAWKFAAIISAGLLFLIMIAALRNTAALPAPQEIVNADMGLVKNLGKVLFTQFLLPFEIASILFLAAMVGAVMLGKRDIK